MARFFKLVGSAFSILFLMQAIQGNELYAYSISETGYFSEGSYAFILEIQVYGNGSIKKKPIHLSSVKFKIKNDKASSEVLKVKRIRIYPEEKIFQDIETIGYFISPGQWVTKYYRLRKEKQVSLSETGYIEIAFEKFTILFKVREHKFQGPLK
jgi:hypothetical protein